AGPRRSPRSRGRPGRRRTGRTVRDRSFEVGPPCPRWGWGCRRTLPDRPPPGKCRPARPVSKNRAGFLPRSEEELLGHGPPFAVSLLVATHLHSDHIGCLPALVHQGTLRADWALV